MDAATNEKTKDAPLQRPETDTSSLHGLRLWVVVGGMMLGVYLVGLDLTMLSTIVPPLTDYFGTINDVAWYETAYVLAVCVFIPPVGRLYTILPSKHVYFAFLAVFEAGSVICAVATSSRVFIVGRAVNGIGSAGLLSGALLIIFAACEPRLRPVVTSLAMSLISVGAITGPLIAGALTHSATWRWCFWIFLPLGGAVLAATLPISVPEHPANPALREALVGLHKKLDAVGFLLVAGLTSMLLLALSWGGVERDWSSPTIVGLLAGAVVLTAAFALWTRHTGDDALIPPSTLRHRAVAVGSVVMFLQGGATQSIPYFLPLWFQAVRGDSPVASAVHMLPSLVSHIVALIAFGALVRRFRYIPPWAIVGSTLASVGAGLLTTLTPETTTAQWVGYQVITSIGRGMAFQVPVISIQTHFSRAPSPTTINPAPENNDPAGTSSSETQPDPDPQTEPQSETQSEPQPQTHLEKQPQQGKESQLATALATVNLALNLGAALSVSLSQTVFRHALPGLLARHAPGVDIDAVLGAGASGVRGIGNGYGGEVDWDGVVVAYGEAVGRMFYLPAACSAVAAVVSFGLGWESVKAGGVKGG